MNILHRSSWRHTLPAVAAGLLAAAVVGTPAAALAPKTTIPGSGTYRVNVDVKPGLYRSLKNNGCYWHRAKDASGSLSSIIANDIVSGQALILVRSTDRIVKVSGCKPFKIIPAAAQKAKLTRTLISGNGAYLVGADFRPGTYRSVGNDGCYWERARSADSSFGSIIANDNVEGQAIVTISATDKVFKTSSCNVWRRVG
jgi:hypothetical protein